jgi:hypothetical protein
MLIACLLAGAAFAEDKPFDFHGIKSGMTRSELRVHLDLDSVAREKMTEDEILYRGKSIDDVVKDLFDGGISAYQVKRLSDREFHLDFYFSDDDRLWRLDVYFYKPSDPAKGIALRQAVQTRFKGFSIKEESATSRYGTREYYRVIMVDQNVLNPAVKRYVDEYLKRM